MPGQNTDEPGDSTIPAIEDPYDAPYQPWLSGGESQAGSIVHPQSIIYDMAPQRGEREIASIIPSVTPDPYSAESPARSHFILTGKTRTREDSPTLFLPEYDETVSMPEQGAEDRAGPSDQDATSNRPWGFDASRMQDNTTRAIAPKTITGEMHSLVPSPFTAHQGCLNPEQGTGHFTGGLQESAHPREFTFKPFDPRK